MTSKYIVEVKNLTKIFIKSISAFPFFGKKRKTVAVNNISFEIRQGEILGLLGPNGAGKTTTIQMLLGLITPTFGTINIFGKNFEKNRKEILKQVNFSSTYTNLPWRLSVWENLYVVALLYGINRPSDKVEQIIKLLNLTSRRNHQVAELSSGWITRLNLARTFINNPRFILLDEPTASLDPEGASQIRDHILRLRKETGTTVLWTSHNMAEVEEVCDRVIFLKTGKIVAEDTPQGLANRISNIRVSLMIKDGKKRLRSILSESNWKAKESGRFIIVEIKEKEVPYLLNSLAAKKIDYSEISIDKSTLEDYFLAMARKQSGTVPEWGLSPHTKEE